MAFDIPIEADRPRDDPGFLSSFVRAPFLWVFGGNLTEKGLDENEQDSTPYPLAQIVKEVRKNTTSSETYQELKRLHSSPLSQQPPELARSDDSEDGDESDTSPEICIQETLSQGISENNSSHSIVELSKSKKQTNISWADVNGDSLVTCTDQSNESCKSYVKSSSSYPRPIKSALKRVSQIKKQSKVTRNPSHCVPSGLSNSSMFPKQKTGQGRGYVSPQWGWYIGASTTPPTPQYNEHVQPFQHQYQTTATQALLGRSPCFKKKLNEPPKISGWSSVPL